MILALDGEPVRNSAGFFRRLRKRQVGELLSLDLKRANVPMQVQAKVALFEAEETPESRIIAGVKVRSLRRAERARFAAASSGGLLVEEITKGSFLDGKVNQGEVILLTGGLPAAPGQSDAEADAFAAQMEKLKSEGGYLEVLRPDGSIERVAFPAIEKP